MKLNNRKGQAVQFSDAQLENKKRKEGGKKNQHNSSDDAPGSDSSCSRVWTQKLFHIANSGVKHT